MSFNIKSFKTISFGLAVSLGFGYIITPYMGAHGHKRKDPEKEAKKQYVKDALLWRQQLEANKTNNK